MKMVIAIALVSSVGDGGTTPASWSAWPGNTLRQDKTLSSLVSNQYITITEEREETLMTVGRKQRCCWSQFDFKNYCRKNSRNITKALYLSVYISISNTNKPNCYCPPSVNMTLKVTNIFVFDCAFTFHMHPDLFEKAQKQFVNCKHVSMLKMALNEYILKNSHILPTVGYVEFSKMVFSTVVTNIPM